MSATVVVAVIHIEGTEATSRSVAVSPEVVAALFAAAEVGLDGADEGGSGFTTATLDAAFDALRVLNPAGEER